MTRLFLGLCALAACHSVFPLRGASRSATPSTCQDALKELKPGDTLNLEPGEYPRLHIVGLNGAADAWITVSGPASGAPAVIMGAPGFNTVEIENSSYVSIENLRIDSRGIPGTFGISARGRERNVTHHIRIEHNTFVGQNGNQQTDGISTKTPTWGWIIRYNRISGAGTGVYLGDSDGTQPFVAGIIENNLIENTIGYNMEIKDQHAIPDIPGMPTGPTSTIIRNNVFMKDDRASPDGDRPNLLVGSFPTAGSGSLNMYEIYGNYFVHNHREALFQGSGRVSLHDNIFIDGPYADPAVVLRKQNLPLRVAQVYNNTVYTSGAGIHVGRPLISDVVVGNLVFAARPITADVPVGVSQNITGSVESAALYVRAPSFDASTADFYPLPGKCRGPALDLTGFQSDMDYTLDFNGASKAADKGVVFRGAYAGEGQNPGWRLAAALKPPSPPLRKIPRVVWVAPAGIGAAPETQIVLTGANFRDGAGVKVSGGGIRVLATKVDSDTQITATVAVAAGAPAGQRLFTVETAAGTSNAFPIRVRPRTPVHHR